MKGPKGTLDRDLPGAITVRQDGDTLLVERPDDERQTRALHGLVRSLVNNMVVGVSRGLHQGARDHRRRLPGHRSRAPTLDLSLGFSHPVKVDAPDGITFEVPTPTRIVVRGIDKEQVGQVAADIRHSASPSPTRARACATSASTWPARPARPRSERRSDE